MIVPKWHVPWRSILEQAIYCAKTLQSGKNVCFFPNMSLAKAFGHVLRDGVLQQSPSTTFMSVFFQRVEQQVLEIQTLLPSNEDKTLECITPFVMKI